MGLEMKSTKGISERKLVVDIVNEIRSNPQFFLYLARLFSDYNKNAPTLLNEIEGQIYGILSAPRLNYDSEKIEYLYGKIKQIYEKDIESFNKIRGEILENTVYHFGPFSNELLVNKCYVEPVILDILTDGEKKVIGDSDIKCDFVFYYDKSILLEFVECKADIANVIPRTRPFEKLKPEHKKKVLYLHHAYQYLRTNYCTPTIYFACYNLNYESILNNLQNNWGYKHMDFINAEEIIKGKGRGA